MRSKLLFALASTVLATGASASFYQYDDGIQDSNLTTSSGAPFNAAFLTHYTAATGGESLTSIDIVWGAFGNTSLPDGLNVDVLLMDDPNGDGDPGDATVLQSIGALTVNSGTNTFNSYALSPTTLSAGTSFFAGALIHDAPSISTWVGMDTSNPGRSVDNWWNVLVTSPVGPYNSMSLFGPDFTFMVRVNAAPVPEPATMAILASGAAFLLRRRKK